MALPVWRLWVSYSEFQYIQLKCEAVSVSRSDPCTLTNVKAFTAVVELEPVKSVRVDTTQHEDSTTSTLILLTAKGEYDVPKLSNEEVNLYSLRIEKILRSGRVLGTQLDALIIEKDVRSNSLIWGIVWIFITLPLAFRFACVLLNIPTYKEWKFDKADNSIVGRFYQFFRRIDHDEIPLNQVQKLNWTLKTRISRDESGEEISRTLTFDVELVLRSGEVIPIISSLWSPYWSFESSEAFSTTISHFLDVEVPELSDISLTIPFKQVSQYTAYLQEQAQLKKQRLNNLED